MTLIDSRLGLVAALGVTALLVSCEELPETNLKDSAGKGGQSTSSGGTASSAGGKAGSGGTGTSASAGKGSAGSSTAGGGTGGTGGSSGSAGSSNASNGGSGGRSAAGGGGTGTNAGNGGEAPGGATNGGDTGGGGRNFSTNRDDFFGDSRCADANVALCEDFEADSLDTGRWMPRGTPEIDDTRAARGAHSAHFHTDDNGLQYIEQTQTFPAPNNTYFVRAFVYFDSMPTAPDWAHWSISGAVGDGNDSEIRVGGQFNPQVDKNLFGVGTDGGPTDDWTNLDDDNGAQPVPVQTWVCLEWMHKGDTSETKFWWDGVEHPSLATTESMHGGTDDPYTLPDFNSIWFGWWLYQERPVPDQYDVWIDEIAVDYARIGCDI